MSLSSAAHRRSERLIGRHSSLLMVVDLQLKLVPVVAQSASVTWNVKRLLDAAQLLTVPHIVTEQYPEKLGSSVDAIGEFAQAAVTKRMFSCRECFEHVAEFRRLGKNQIVLCGIESHVCVLQTALDLVAAGWSVFAVVDAMSSRAELDHSIALERMRSESVVLTTTESVLFEWCETSVAPEFRSISGLVRQERPRE